MNKVLLDYIANTNPWHSSSRFRYKCINRRHYLNKLNRDDRLIDILTGARRVGKTFIIYSVLNKLLTSGIVGKNILYLTGEAREVKKFGLQEVITEHMNQNKIKYQDTLYAFVDEVQEIKNWQNDVKFLFDATRIKFFLTGSSGVVLNEKTSKLAGRFIRTNVLPLSFEEFLLFIGTRLNKITVDKRRTLFEEYLKVGGYPEYVVNRNDDYLRQAISSSLYRDLLSYYGIRNPAFLRELLNYLVDKVGSPVSLLRVKNDLKVDHKTADFYLKYLQEVYLIYPVYRYGRSYKITRASNPKYYLNDTGIQNLLALSPKIGALAENSVFLKLLRNTSWLDNHQIYYTDVSGHEIDFQVQGNHYEVKYQHNYEREDFSSMQGLVNNLEVIVPHTKKQVADCFPNVKFTEAWQFVSGI